MSVGIFPQYNAGKVIGEINWFDLIAVKSGASKTYNEVETDNIIFPINKHELNEIYIGFNGGSCTSSDGLLAKDSIPSYFSSEQNMELTNIVAFLRDCNVGQQLEFKDLLGTTRNRLYIKLISYGNDNFIIRLRYKYNDSSNTYIRFVVSLGWR
ncbi:hypothetical protein [Dielma fastidiosa]|uniref:Uncharacterized protein n=1 Tax=Dielma fastidiosa TaxID=1034346 RepID=A0AB35UPC9_9FIRM|nr:hypothetical protein [Dielma fastidiosa]MDY5168617.1 hypothetical protein [Dielma fastidiosa]